MKKFELSPLHSVDRLVDIDGRSLFACSGEDPQLQVDGVTAEQRLPAGWYSLQWCVSLRTGSIAAPCLYPDYGFGFSEQSKIPLPEPDATGIIRAVILLAHSAVCIRADPSVSDCLFEDRGITFSRISRTGAALRMLRRMRQPDGRWHWFLAGKTLAAMLVSVLSGHSRSAGEYCLSVYRRNKQDSDRSYSHWIERYSAPTLQVVGRNEQSDSLPEEMPAPLISVVVPVYNTDVRWLKACVQSVQAQIFQSWELILVDDGSTLRSTRSYLAELDGGDRRVRVLRRHQNDHVAQATNDGILASRGGWVAFLDHDDELSPHALREMAAAILMHPDAGLLYSDEDKIDEAGHRFDPNFKPDWNRELLLGQNYICHLTVIRRDLLDQVGLLRVGYEGSQDHDLVLRCTEQLRDDQIVHVPQVLYHWRAIEGSTARSGNAKAYAVEAGRHAVADALQRRGIDASVEDLHGGYFRVRRRLPNRVPSISLIIPTRDRVDLLRTAVESILRVTEYPDFEVVVVDNQSVDPEACDYLQGLHQRPSVRVLNYDAPFNFSAINNFAVRQCRGELVGLINNDIEAIHADWLAEMATRAIEPSVGAVGAMLYYPNGTIQHAGVIVGIGGVAGHVHMRQRRGCDAAFGRSRLAQDMTAVTGACMLVRRDLYESVGGLDEQLSVAFNDIDFCLRLSRAGFRNLWTPWAELYHHESASRGFEDTSEKQARFQREVGFMQERWGGALRRDPAYNPNLSLESQQFELAFPPRDRWPASGRGRLFSQLECR